jgi:protein-L-isoaspartate(D-aspartate) O-methyltransferase
LYAEEEYQHLKRETMTTYHNSQHFKKQRTRLVHQIKEKGITDNRVLNAIYTIPRHLYMPHDLEEMAYEDRAFPIGEGQTISQPYTVAYQTQLLEVQSNDRVLEIGTGSAYQASILVLLAAEVFSIERQRKLFEKQIHFRYLREFTNLYLFYGDGNKGLAEYAPYDKILITAAAPVIPPRLIEQLKPGGKMVLPLGEGKLQKMIRVSKLNDEEIKKEQFDNFSFVPMLQGTKE